MELSVIRSQGIGPRIPVRIDDGEQAPAANQINLTRLHELAILSQVLHRYPAENFGLAFLK